MYILLVYERELSKDDYQRPLLLAINKKHQKVNKVKTIWKWIQTDIKVMT